MLRIVPIFQIEAFAFVQQHHRHHKKPVGSVFQIAIQDDDKICGVAIVGRPVNRTMQDGFTLEVTRLCSDGTKNVCSALYSACWRVARELGYRKLITYILNTEPGTSLRAAGWQLIGERGGGTWNRPNRQRVDKHPVQKKFMFSKNI